MFSKLWKHFFFLTSVIKRERGVEFCSNVRDTGGVNAVRPHYGGLGFRTFVAPITGAEDGAWGGSKE